MSHWTEEHERRVRELAKKAMGPAGPDGYHRLFGPEVDVVAAIRAFAEPLIEDLAETKRKLDEAITQGLRGSRVSLQVTGLPPEEAKEVILLIRRLWRNAVANDETLAKLAETEATLEQVRTNVREEYGRMTAEAAKLKTQVRNLQVDAGRTVSAEVKAAKAEQELAALCAVRDAAAEYLAANYMLMDDHWEATQKKLAAALAACPAVGR